MEAALVSVATGVMKPLLSKLSTLLEGEYTNQRSVRRNTEFLRGEMSTMSATLQILADSEELDPQMKIWRDDVRELSYDMEDCVDDVMSRVEHEGDGPLGLKAIYDWFKKLKPRHEIGDKIKQLKTRASEASERHKRYKFVQPTPESSISAIDPRLPAFYEEVDNLVGINGPKTHIIEWFKREGSSTQLKVLSIVGPGGLGKTTLANQVFATIESQFSCAAFVSVSRNPNMKKILRDIAKGVGITDNTYDDDVKQLIDRLRKHLQDERYFIVIDDVWDTRAWETIKLALLNNNLGCRVITTTRNTAIASCASQGGYVYRMEPLSFADSKRLFFKRAFDSMDLCYPHLEQVSKGILEKCAGLPLAIITMASLLADQHAEDEWKRVLTAIGSALANDPNAGNMTKILSLSYYDLPQHLRTCLLYFCMFPEDYQINKQSLISRWIAEGFIHKEQWRGTYEVGEDYFNDLINRSLIQPVDVLYGQAEACQVHDIILDFIKCKAAEENFVTSFTTAEHEHNSGHRVRRLCVENRNNEKVTILSKLNLSHVRSLTTFGCFVPNSLLAFPVLRVLDVGECSWLKGHHLANIEKLILLKYLRLGKSSISELPIKIGELQYLETLDVRSTWIEELPSTIAKLPRLTRLYVHRSTKFPYGVIGQMQSLEELDEFGVLSYKQERVEALQEFSQLTKLRRLKVLCSGRQSQADNLRSFLGTLITSCNLYHLYILHSHSIPSHRRLSLLLESWCPTTQCSLQKLHITHCFINKVPSWMRSLGNLRDLKLYIFSMRHEDVDILGSISTLLFLKVETLYGVDGRILIRGFKSLKYFSLRIFYCGTCLEFEARSMPKLDHLKLEFCGHDACDFGIQHLSTLTKVEVVISKGDLHSADMVGTLVTTAIETLPNHPTLSFVYQQSHAQCVHYEKFVASYKSDKEEEDDE